MRKNFAVILFLALQMSLNSQSSGFSLEDCIYMNRDILPATLNNLQWIPGTNNYSYIRNDTLFMGNLRSPKDRVVTNKDLLETDGLSQVSWTDNKSFLYLDGSELNLFNIRKGEIEKINSFPIGENIDRSEKSNFYAYTRGNDLLIMRNSEEIIIADSEENGIIYGTERAHRNEFGITKGTFWSPNDNFLAFYRMDETMVTDYPLIDISGRIATSENIKYPMAGMTSHIVTLGIYDLKKSETIYIRTGEPSDQYLTVVTWDPSERFIYIGILNREQDHLKFNKYDVSTGNLVGTLFEERDKEYVEPQYDPLFLSNDPSRFIWQSRRDGWNHLYLYSNEGELIDQLTTGEWEVTGIVGINEKNDKLFFTSTKDSPIENNIYSLDLISKEITRVSSQHGTHQSLLSSDGEYLIDIYSNMEVVNRYEITDYKGKIIKTLLDSDDPYKHYELGKVTLGTLQNSNGDDLYYRLITPPELDTTKKYPVFFYVYGGPHLQMVTNERYGGASIWDFRWAQRGYIVFSIDNRGTPNRGADFEQAIHRQLGRLEIEDQMVGVNFLRSLPFVDSDRMAVDGWSYGGFMTTSLMLKQPGIFSVGVAGGPVIDWKYYEVMYGERYMDTPVENPEGYANASLLNHVDKLKGDLMLIHSVTDPVVVLQNSLSFIDQCVKSGILVDLFLYPGHDHNVTGIDRIHLYKKIEDYIDTKLSR